MPRGLPPARPASAIRLWVALLRPEVLSICLFIFVADIITGAISPTFPLFARGSGASLSLLGGLTATGGLMRVAGAMPMGAVFDRWRKPALMGGMALFAVTSLGLTLMPSVGLLALPMALYGLARVATFPLGVAYLIDVVSVQEQAPAVSLYATAMGSGFAVGSAAGGFATVHFGFHPTYQALSMLALLAVIWAQMRLPVRRTRTARYVGPLRPGLAAIKRVAGGHDMKAAALVGLLTNLSFNAAITTFLPVYAHELGMSAAIVGIIFSIRSVASASARIPTGILMSLWSTKGAMLIGLAVDILALLLVRLASHPVDLTVVAAAEGIGSGIMMTSSQALVSGGADAQVRGLAMGLYTTVGSLGEALGSLLLGLVAQVLGVASVFTVTGAALLSGALLISVLLFRSPGSRVEPVQN